MNDYISAYCVIQYILWLANQKMNTCVFQIDVAYLIYLNIEYALYIYSKYCIQEQMNFSTKNDQFSYFICLTIDIKKKIAFGLICLIDK
jgi:hypothetical protein